MLGIESLSDFLGYASIGCWLGAQFPQVLENIRLQSVEGLALPFLANWLLGDLTNLLGCILTHQLPFQTYLAVYFCLVDFTLFGQYFYYRKPKPSPQYLPVRSRTTSSATRRLSIERPAHYRTLSNVAAHVAVAAARAAEQEEHIRWHRSSLESSHSATRDTHTEEDEVDEQTLARLTESFHSERGARSGRQKTVAWSTERRGESLGRTQPPPMSSTDRQRVHHGLHMTSPTIEREVDFSSRGRPLSRPHQDASISEEWSASKRRNSRASRKGATMVFLGMWALFGVGSLASSGRGLPSTTGVRVGRVVTMEESITSQFVPKATAVDMVSPSSAAHDIHSLSDMNNEFASSQSDPDEPGPPTDYIIGRISAWICTTMYLTSRLPQIWKNFTRKSVEGLSIFLFVFAFLGNFFYVASILASPKLSLPESQSSAFLRESIPYLLGSGGTLMFDVTIVAQSFIYRPKSHNRGRRKSRTVNEEEAGLLSAGATGAEDPVSTPSRRRLPILSSDALASPTG
ncbi:hypothetical protein K474DRAFT_1654730 [Panus rudis PR-1116 ss-1]|nr:hypothetical protein K474DRAFT_1654730 [Panus rudis PR-1116 ss-1]